MPEVVTGNRGSVRAAWLAAALGFGACSREADVAAALEAAPGEGLAALTGRVTDSEGRAIAGARVCAGPWWSGWSGWARPTCTEADAQGRYRVEVAPGRLRVSAMAPEFVAGSYVRDAGARATESIDAAAGVVTRDVDVRLAPGGVAVHGRVFDLHGAPVAGAVVRTEDVCTLADDGGAFTLWLAPGRRSVAAWAEGFAPDGDDGPAPGHAFMLRLPPESVVVGKVVRASDGAPVAGAEISVRIREWSDEGVTARSGADGGFRVGGLRSGVYRTEALGDDAEGAAADHVVLGLGETSAPVVITAEPRFMVEGRVVAADGSACAAGTVRLSDGTADHGRQGGIGADGVARVRGLVPGVYKVTVRCTGTLPEHGDATVEVVDRSVRGSTWTVRPGATLRGMVVDAAGGPVPEVQVVVMDGPEGGATWMFDARRIHSDAGGAFVIGGLMPGQYRLQPVLYEVSRQVPEKWPEVEISAADEVKELRIELPPTGELRGQVRDTNGVPVAQAEVWLSAAPAVLTADDGTFVFPYAPAGESHVGARVSGAEVSAGTVKLQAGERRMIDMTLAARTGRISGRVLADGRPVAGALVEVMRQHERHSRGSSNQPQSRVAPVLTADDGTFLVTGLADLMHEVRVQRPGGGEAQRVVEAGTDVVLNIEAPGTISGTVRVRNREMEDDVLVSLRDEATGYERMDWFRGSGGAWRFPAVPPGEYTLHTSVHGESVERTVTLRAGGTIAGVELEAAPNVVVRGTIIDEAGAPIAGLEVQIADEGRRFTDKAGRFEFERVSPGRTTLRIDGGLLRMSWNDDATSLDGDGYGHARRTFEVPESPAEFELAPIRMVRDRMPDRGMQKGNLGYAASDYHPQEADEQPRGVNVLRIYPGEQAARAGLRVGDEIVAVDGVDVTGVNRGLYERLRDVPAGTSITLKVARGVSVRLRASEWIKRPWLKR